MLGFINNEVEPDKIKVTRHYKSYTDWLEDVMMLSNETNKTVVAKRLAKINKLSLSEFVAKYKP